MRRALLGLLALIIVGGFGLALLSGAGPSLAGPNLGSFGALGSSLAQTSASNTMNGYGGLGNTQVIGQVTTATVTATMSSSTTMATTTGTNGTATQGSPRSGGGLIEFSTDLGIMTPSPQKTASAISALAYTVGGYVAYQSTYSDSAYIVIRVPSAQYQSVLNQVMRLGTFVSETSNSNDVSVQYTDMNATLASLRTEQSALLRLLNQTSAINSTLAVETQLQQVNQQINYVESEILQTRTLISYATINVTVSETAQSTPLVLALSATPANGTSPLSVTFNARVKGGAQPYVVNYNFGDGTATEGQIVIHTFYQAGNYIVVASATDQNGTVVQKATTVKVVAAPATSGVGGFFNNMGNLFINVVEGIVEVAVVVLPLAAIGFAIIIPIQRRGRAQKSIKQSQ